MFLNYVYCMNKVMSLNFLIKILMLMILLHSHFLLSIMIPKK